MCQRDASTWSTKHLNCVSDIVGEGDVTIKEQQCLKFSASASNAVDIYKRLCIIYFCDEREATQVASITFTPDGVRLINLGANVAGDTLPASVFLPRSMFALYNLYPSKDSSEVQILVNFSTLMDFLECGMASVTQEDLVHPMHLVLDTWLYLSLQRSPTIGDLDKAMSTSLSAAINRFCLIPTECFGESSGDASQTVPPSSDQVMREYDEMMDNTILMLHPLNAKQLDPSIVYPFAYPTLSKLPPRQPSKSHAVVPLSKPSPPARSSPDSSSPSEPGQPPRKRLKTTSDQLNQLEEWFQKEPLPPRKVREEMVQRLDGTVSLRQLEVWFQNRRAKQKKADARAHSHARRGGVNADSEMQVPQSPMDVMSPPASPLSPLSTMLIGMAPNSSTLIPSASPPTTPRENSPDQPSSPMVVPVSPPNMPHQVAHTPQPATHKASPKYPRAGSSSQ